MASLHRTTVWFLAALLGPWGALSQTARISEEVRVFKTYPFSEPNPVPILTRDPRLYPYHSFEGYASEGAPREWKVVRLENDLIEVFVLPEAGGKVWGAVVKKNGHEFIYRNEVMKFRNIALRGPWTSGGIEFNFGVIGHTPATATPVDYLLRENSDGSVSCFVGTMDLPSRTHWRVEIRLPADRAYFETNVLWYNPTPLEQPYYNWMTAAAFARDDLEMSIPGNAYLTHPGESRPWPVDSEGRYLAAYDNNRFDGHKSYHVVGELNDFFGGYYHDDDYGFGHWSRYEEMPGQKLWLWALSREGGVWEDLLTDTDGQYVEFQAGRLFVQYSPGSHVNPITQARFDPGAADRWSETWFPLEGTGGLTDASRDGGMYVQREAGSVRVAVNAFGDFVDTLRVSAGERVLASLPLELRALVPVEEIVDLDGATDFRVELRALGLDYASDTTERELARPFEQDPAARLVIPKADQLAFEANELHKGRRYSAAREMFEAALQEEPWHRVASLELADLEYRRGLYEVGLAHVDRALQLDAYDAEANFVAGNLYRALGRDTDAREAYGWAARSMAFRSAAYVQLAELMLASGDQAESKRYARLALDYDRYNISARQVLAMVGRESGDAELFESMCERLHQIDPLNHFVLSERYLASIGSPDEDTYADRLLASLRSEYPDQTLLELAVDYVRRGSADDARILLRLAADHLANPVLGAWLAWIEGDPTRLAASPDLAFAFPYRRETLMVLDWAARNSDHWSWDYLLALNLWARDRTEEAATLLRDIDEAANYAPLYVARAHLLDGLHGRDAESDLRRAVELDESDRTLHVYLIRYLQDRGRWADALAASTAGRTLFPDDFNLDLMHVRSLNELDRPRDAIDILNATHVLPSENSRESHRLFEQAHTLVALYAMASESSGAAREHLMRALQWPEHLGQGRPYQPEERMVQYLLGVVDRRLGNDAGSRGAFEEVVAATERSAGPADRLDLLAIAAMVALDRRAEIREMWADTESDVGRLGVELLRATETAEISEELISRLAAEYPGLFEDLEGRMLLRALKVGGR